ncbi:MAG: flagellar export protein FliJ [Anaerolineae bacterium]
MPKTEEFRLQSVLNLKVSLVDNLEVEFAHLRVAYQQEVERLDNLQHRTTDEMELLSQQQQSGSLDCKDIQLRQQYLQRLVESIVQQNLRVKQAEQHMETKREELVKMMQDQKTLEKLREHHDAKQRQFLLRREAGMVDDIVTTRYGRER